MEKETDELPKTVFVYLVMRFVFLCKTWAKKMIQTIYGIFLMPSWAKAVFVDMTGNEEEYVGTAMYLSESVMMLGEQSKIPIRAIPGCDIQNSVDL